MNPITENERRLMQHVSMFGSAGYPVQKIGTRWFWVDAFGVSGSPSAYRTKRAAIAAFELWCDLYRMRAGQETYERATAHM